MTKKAGKKKKKFKVDVRYTGCMTYEVEADNEEAAQEIAMDNLADESAFDIQNNIGEIEAEAREVKE